MSDMSPFSASRDEELGAMLRDALAPHHDAAFVTRVRARVGVQQPAWENELARWFWQGLAAASVAMVAAGYASPGRRHTDRRSIGGDRALNGASPVVEVLSPYSVDDDSPRNRALPS